MKVISFLTLLAIVGSSTARKIIIKSNPDRNAELFQDTKFTFSQDKEDNKEPTIFKGDPMKSKTLVSENVQGKKNFKFALGTQNGIEIEQVGKLKDDNKTLVVKGSYSYTGADGRRYRVRYTADELGFHPITELELEIPDIDPNAGKGNNALNKIPGFGASRDTNNLNANRNGLNNQNKNNLNNRNGLNGNGRGGPKKSPFSQSNFLNKRYLPPTNTYLPPSNDYLPPQNEITGDLQAP